MITSIISGGQTGADQGGLYAGQMLGLQTGGWCAANWMTELGPQKELLQGFGLIEDGKFTYDQRTVINVRMSDGTVLFGNLNSPGSRLTASVIQQMKRPNVHFDIPWNMQDRKRYFRDWVERNGILVLNVAGNRESKNKGIGEEVCKFLLEVLG